MSLSLSLSLSLNGYSRDTSKDDRYWRARRSLRLWPIKGQDLRVAVGDFMTNLLGLDPDFLQDLASYEIRPVRSTRSKVPNEVVVIFPDVDTRDSVRRSASNLAGNTGGNKIGNPGVPPT